MRRQPRPDVIVWTPDKPESHPRRWKIWQERKDPWGSGFGSVPGTVQISAEKPTEAQLQKLPKVKDHRWVIGPI